MNVLRSVFRLIGICVSTKEGKIGIVFYVAILLLYIIGIRISVKLITWNKEFYDALGRYDTASVFLQIKWYVFLTVISCGIYLLTTYLKQHLQIRWRSVLTERALDVWLRNKNYWYLESSDRAELDNPDQRIAEDCRLFVEHLTVTTLELINKVIGLITYVTVLWNVANYALTFTVFANEIVVSRYLVWVAPIYVLTSSILTHGLGRPLIALNVEQKRREADFRFALTRFRESKEAIVLQSGEGVERGVMDARFGQIASNWKRLITREFILGCFTRPYFVSILRIPVFLSLPAYLMGRLSLGAMMQMSAAFQNVVVNLSWFILSYKDLATLAASSVRFDAFLNAAEQFSYDCKERKKKKDTLEISRLTLYSPEDKHLLGIDSLKISKGSTVLVKGRSGKGKSTLFRTIAGLYHNYSGQIYAPDNSAFFLPQKAYFPLGGLAHAVSYPNLLDENDLPKIREILKKVQFPERNIEQRFMQYDMGQLSGGEQQRLIIARVLYNKPEWIFMDESTNALDRESERFLMELLYSALPGATYVIISHSGAMNAYAQNLLQVHLDSL